ncbi:MAG: DUF6020 family protein [Bilifractor sp.]|jgi:hypothetical protein
MWKKKSYDTDNSSAGSCRLIFGKKAERPFLSAMLCAILAVLLFDLGLLADDRVISKAGIFHGTGAAVLLAVLSAAAALLLGLLISRLYRRWDRTPAIDSVTSQENDAKQLLRLTLLILLCWVPYIIIRFPGNYDPDTWQQLLQTYGLTARSDHHPWFDTLIFSAFWRIGDAVGSHQFSLFLYGILQMAATAGTFAYTTLFLKRCGIGRRARKACFLFWAFYPFIPTLAQTMAKDMLNGWIFLLYAVFYLEYIRKDAGTGRSWKDTAKFIAVGIFLSLTKKTGIYIFLLSSVLLAFLLWRNWKRMLRLGAEILAVAFTCIFLWEGVCLPAMGVAKGDSKELMSVPSQQITWYLIQYGDTLDAEEREILSGVYSDIDGMTANYNPVRADATKSHWREDSTKEARSRFYRLYVRLFFRHPGNYLMSFCANIYPMLAADSTTMNDESLLYYRDNVPTNDGGGEAWEKIYSSWSNGMAAEADVHRVMESSYKPASWKQVSESFDTIYSRIASAATVLFSKVLFVTWIPLLVIFYAFHKRSWKMLFALSPAFWSIMTLVAGPILLPRYMVSLVYLAPVLLCIPRMQFLYRREKSVRRS